MTAYILSVVTNTHEYGFFRRADETLRTWQQRARARRELARWSERELHDIGTSRSAISEEVNKPFWKA
jgi:uncharacterized protein YjiS (DUF1127 family)